MQKHDEIALKLRNAYNTNFAKSFNIRTFHISLSQPLKKDTPRSFDQNKKDHKSHGGNQSEKSSKPTDYIYYPHNGTRAQNKYKRNENCQWNLGFRNHIFTQEIHNYDTHQRIPCSFIAFQHHFQKERRQNFSNNMKIELWKYILITHYTLVPVQECGRLWYWKSQVPNTKIRHRGLLEYFYSRYICLETT